jgi:diguanylate cyclase (GGDEF)-like protein
MNMVINVNLDQLNKAIRGLEQEKIPRAERGFLIRLLRELAETAENSPRMDGEAHPLIQIQVQTAQEGQPKLALDEKLAEQERIRLASNPGLGQTDIQKTMNALVEEAAALIDNLSDASIYTYEAGKLTLGAAHSNGETSIPVLRTPRSNGLTYTAARLGQTLIIPDMASHGLFAGTGWEGSIIGIPLKVGPRVVGVFTARRTPILEFSPDEIRVLHVLADQAATEIETARIFALAGEKVRIDPTTGLHNRHAFDERLQTEMRNSTEINSPFSVFLIGIDGIREVNQRYGRSAADYLLAGIATAAAQTLRKTDFIARYDDARWGLILSRADQLTAQTIAERIQDSVQKKRFGLPEATMRSISLTMGIAVFPENGRSPEGLVESADQALRTGQTEAPGSVRFAENPGTSSNQPPAA